MIRQIIPVFVTADIPATITYYTDKLGFELLGTWSPGKDEPPVYAILARDQQVIHFRCAEDVAATLAAARSAKYTEEILDAYIQIEDADALYAEFAAKGVEFARGLGDMPWKSREFVVKDGDGRLLAFGASL